MSEPVNTAVPVGSIDPKIMAKIKIPRKFEIFVEELDDEKGWRPVTNATIPGMPNSNPVITVSSKEDLQEKVNLYKAMEQRFKIIREIDPPTPEQIREMAIQQGIDLGTGEQTTEIKSECPVAVVQPEVKKFSTQTIRIPGTGQPQTVVQNVMVQKSKPKIVTIGDMQLKYDGDRVYQKQWIKLNATESRNFRVVSDSNNKLVPMTGKHIEALKWVLVEETEENEDDSAEKIINA